VRPAPSAVILFTTALFLSGYTIQQRTLRDLRRAIRPDPRPSPKIYLPDRFKQSTTELADGRVVGIDEDHEGAAAAAQGPDGSQQQPSAHKGDFVVEVRPSVAGGEDGAAAQKPLGAAGARGDAAAVIAPGGGDKANGKQDGKTAKKGGDGGSKGKVEAEEEKPISSAERRRRIKEEIRQLSQGETPLYYQRRLW
jgi:hypothetical protein